MFRVATGPGMAVGTDHEVTYSVEVEAGLPYGPGAVADFVDAVLQDGRGWTTVMATSVRRVSRTPDFRVVLASPDTTDNLCAPLETGGRLSCRNGQMVVLNAWRWANGAHSYAGRLARYRTYVVNHEFGHALGNGHASCPGQGDVAPVMLQQTKGLDGCRANPWPAVG